MTQTWNFGEEWRAGGGGGSWISGQMNDEWMKTGHSRWAKARRDRWMVDRANNDAHQISFKQVKLGSDWATHYGFSSKWTVGIWEDKINQTALISMFQCLSHVLTAHCLKSTSCSLRSNAAICWTSSKVFPLASRWRSSSSRPSITSSDLKLLEQIYCCNWCFFCHQKTWPS